MSQHVGIDVRIKFIKDGGVFLRNTGKLQGEEGLGSDSVDD